MRIYLDQLGFRSFETLQQDLQIVLQFHFRCFKFHHLLDQLLVYFVIFINWVQVVTWRLETIQSLVFLSKRLIGLFQFLYLCLEVSHGLPQFFDSPKMLSDSLLDLGDKCILRFAELKQTLYLGVEPINLLGNEGDLFIYDLPKFIFEHSVLKHPLIILSLTLG